MKFQNHGVMIGYNKFLVWSLKHGIIDGYPVTDSFDQN